MTQRTFSFAIMVILLVSIGSIALLIKYKNQKAIVVNYGIVATRDASGNKVTINEYDREAVRRQQGKLFASAVSRQCDIVIPRVQSVTLDVHRNWLDSDLFSDAWFGSQQSQELDREVITVLRSEQKQVNDALERVFEAQAAFRVGNGFKKHLSANEQSKAKEMMVVAIRSFDALKQELINNTETYCEHIRKLK